MTIFPILNPNGLAVNLRGNSDGIDLNRDYRNSKSAEIQSHIEALKTLGRFHAAMMLHEDFEGIGAYLYELNDGLPPGLGGEIIAAMGRHVPIDMRPEIEEVPAHGGVLSRKDLIAKLGRIEDRPEWPEAIYLQHQSHESQLHDGDAEAISARATRGGANCGGGDVAGGSAEEPARVIAEAKDVRYHVPVTKRKHFAVLCSLIAILLLFQVIDVSHRSEEIAQEAFREHCNELHADTSAYKMVYDKTDLWGHYYDFSLTPPPPGTYPGEMGYYRVHVSWLGTTRVGGLKGLPR